MVMLVLGICIYILAILAVTEYIVSEDRTAEFGWVVMSAVWSLPKLYDLAAEDSSRLFATYNEPSDSLVIEGTAAKWISGWLARTSAGKTLPLTTLVNIDDYGQPEYDLFKTSFTIYIVGRAPADPTQIRWQDCTVTAFPDIGVCRRQKVLVAIKYKVPDKVFKDTWEESLLVVESFKTRVLLAFLNHTKTCYSTFAQEPLPRTEHRSGSTVTSGSRSLQRSGSASERSLQRSGSEGATTAGGMAPLEEYDPGTPAQGSELDDERAEAAGEQGDDAGSTVVDVPEDRVADFDQLHDQVESLMGAPSSDSSDLRAPLLHR